MSETKTKGPGLFARLRGKDTPPTTAQLAEEMAQLAEEQRGISAEIGEIEQQLVESWGEQNTARETRLAILQTRQRSAGEAMQRLEAMHQEAQRRDLLTEFEAVCRDAVAARDENTRKQAAYIEARRVLEQAHQEGQASLARAEAARADVMAFLADRGITPDRALSEAVADIRLRTGWIDEHQHGGELQGIERAYKLASGWRPQPDDGGYNRDADKVFRAAEAAGE